MSALLEVDAVSVRFGGLTAVDAVSIAVPAGEVRAIIGPNGAGKTTLVGAICGRVRADSGRIVLGADISRLPAHARARRGIVYTFQVTSIFPTLSVRDNVALAAQRGLMRGVMGRLAVDRRVLDARVRGALARAGLEVDPEQPASALAYGHQRLLELAMGLALAPRVLILDEPTQGLAEGEIAHFRTLVRELAGTVSVLLIEHNVEVVLAVADHITVLDQGRVLAEGTPRAIAHDPEVQRAYLGG